MFKLFKQSYPEDSQFLRGEPKSACRGWGRLTCMLHRCFMFFAQRGCGCGCGCGATRAMVSSCPPRWGGHFISRWCNDLRPLWAASALRAAPGTRCTTTASAPLGSLGLRTCARQADGVAARADVTAERPCT